MKTILLKFAGPLQSWGTDSHFERRDTDRYPSKSAVIGMIAASCGFRRDEDDKINELNSLDFALRVDQPGKLLRDFHIATKKRENGKVDRIYVTNRYYLQDAVFVVAIGSTNNLLIEAISDSLKSPYFQPFLGRRALPLNADFFVGVVDNGVIEVLMKLPWQASKWYQNKYRESKIKKLEIYADGDLIDTSNIQMKRDLVRSFSSEKREHSFRPVAKRQVELSLEHDALSALGG